MTKKKETAVAVADPQVAAIATMTEAKDIEGLNNARAMAEGLKKAAKARGMGIADENKASELVLRSERGIGLVLIDMKEEGAVRRPGRNPGDSLKVGTRELQPVPVPSIGDLGITKDQSSKFQALARLPDERFEALLESVKAKSERIAKVDFYRGAVVDEEKYAKQQYREPESWPVLTALRKAVAEVEGLASLPGVELAEAKDLIQTLVSGYAEEKKRRGSV